MKSIDDPIDFEKSVLVEKKRTPHGNIHHLKLALLKIIDYVVIISTFGFYMTQYELDAKFKYLKSKTKKTIWLPTVYI